MSYQDTVLAFAPLLYLPMTETAGTSLADLTGNGRNAAPSFSPDIVVGGADSFLTGEKAVTIPTPRDQIVSDAGLAYPTIDAWSLDFWLAFDAGAYLQQIDFTFIETPRVSVSLQRTTASTISPFVAWQPGGQTIIGDQVTLPHVNCWHYYTFTYDTNGLFSWYVDGVVQATVDTGFAGLTFHPASGVVWDNNQAASGGFSLAHSAFYPRCLSAADVAAIYAAATPRQDAACFGQWLRLRHAGGRSYIQQNGEQVQVVAGGAGVFDLPLPALAAPPNRYVGQDPATGLPAFCPAPIPTTTTLVLGGGGGSQPAPAPQCVQMRCGVSGACRDHLVSLYQDWSHWLDPLFQAAATLGVAAAIVSIPWDWTVDLEVGMVIKSGIISLLHDFGSAITGNLLPVLDLDLQTDIQRALFDHLTCVNDQVQVSADNVAAWKAALDALTTWPIASLAGPFCGLLLQYTPLARWQAAASTASPSTVCDAWP